MLFDPHHKWLLQNSRIAPLAQRRLVGRHCPCGYLSDAAFLWRILNSQWNSSLFGVFKYFSRDDQGNFYSPLDSSEAHALVASAMAQLGRHAGCLPRKDVFGVSSDPSKWHQPVPASQWRCLIGNRQLALKCPFSRSANSVKSSSSAISMGISTEQAQNAATEKASERRKSLRAKRSSLAIVSWSWGATDFSVDFTQLRHILKGGGGNKWK